jgi:hypothetical protein
MSDASEYSETESEYSDIEQGDVSVSAPPAVSAPRSNAPRLSLPLSGMQPAATVAKLGIPNLSIANTIEASGPPMTSRRHTPEQQQVKMIAASAAGQNVSVRAWIFTFTYLISM